MSHTPQYELLRNSISSADHLAVFNALLPHVGRDAAIRLDDLVTVVYGHAPDEYNEVMRNAWLDSHRRKIRDAIEDLRRDYHVPVMSESGRPGRWLAADEQERATFLADMRARRASLDAVIRAMERAEIPPARELPERAVQAGLF